MEKRNNLLLVLLMLILNRKMLAQEIKQDWSIIWSDEFSYTGLPDSSKWGYDMGGNGWGNNELQYYTSSRLKNSRVENGNLIIEAHRESYEGKDYTSARLVTRGKGTWNEGKIEVRAKFSSGNGTWPAIWMLSATEPLKWPQDGEIDIMEHVGFDHGRVHGTIHTQKYNHMIGTQKANQVNVPDCSNDFHIYQLIWNREELKIGIDDQYYFTYKNEQTGIDGWPFDNKMYLILNMAVGGNWGGQKGIDKTIWPARLEVDFVRVYQKN